MLDSFDWGRRSVCCVWAWCLDPQVCQLFGNHAQHASLRALAARWVDAGRSKLQKGYVPGGTDNPERRLYASLNGRG